MARGRRSRVNVRDNRSDATTPTAAAASTARGRPSSSSPPIAGRRGAQHHRRDGSGMPHRERGRAGAVVGLAQPPGPQRGAVLVAHARARFVAQPPARRVQAQHEVDVLGDPHPLVEPRPDGGPAHEQSRARHVRHPGPRHHQGGDRAEVQRRADGLVGRQPAHDRGQRHDPRRREPDGRVGEASEQRVEPAGLGHDVGVDERDERRVRGGEAGVAGGGRTTRGRVPQHAGSRPRRNGRDRLRGCGAVVHDHQSAQSAGQRREEPGQPVGAVPDGYHDGDVGERGRRTGRPGPGVRDPHVEQAAGQGGRGRTGHGDRAAAGEHGLCGAAQVQHPRRRAPDQDRATVEDAGLRVQLDPEAGRQPGVGRSGRPRRTGGVRHRAIVPQRKHRGASRAPDRRGR